jgi:hypothetical protein
MKNEETEIEKMAPGPELDRLIEEEIFQVSPLSDEEWQLIKVAWNVTSPSWRGFGRPLKFPRKEKDPETGAMYSLRWPQEYSTHPMSREGLVEKMRADGWMFQSDDLRTKEGIKRHVRFYKWTGKEEIEGQAIAERDAHAICLAALKAVRALKAVTK